MKRALVLMVVHVMSVVMLSCSPVKDTSDFSGSGETVRRANSTNNAPTIKAVFSVPTGSADMQEVYSKLSELVLRKINVKVDVEAYPFCSWNRHINLKLVRNERIDVMVEFNKRFTKDVARGSLLPLDDLLKSYGQDILRTVGEEYIKAGQVNGKTYMVPSIRDMASGYGICMRKDLLDKYNIDHTKIKTVEDIEAMFEIIKEGEPELYITWSQNADMTVPDQLLYTRDVLSDGFGVLLNMGQDDLKVVNWYETKEYAEILKIMRRWYEAGYIYPDAVTSKDQAVSLVKSGKLFSFCSKLKPGFDRQTSKQTGKEMVSACIIPPFSTSYQIVAVGWAIPKSCEYPKEAMQFINLMYSDPEIVNLLDWGIEGKHYVKIGGNIIDYPPGVDANNSGYNLTVGWMFGNQLISYIWNGDSPDLYKKLDEFNKNAIKSKALGFQFDLSPVITEIAALTEVQDEYKFALENGVVDPDVVLPRFISALKNAGIDKVIEEKQRQLDKWAKSQTGRN